MIVSQIASQMVHRYSKQSPLIKDFTHLSSMHSPSRNITLHQYQHYKTKARIYHFQSTDSQQAYASIIKTYVTNNKGCPHILQHLACCGSRNYPIRDPFFNMIKRSVNSYMNAWTGDDFTAYPFASANPRDWQNLYKVYLDMSLRPSLNRLDFLQEGWRYEISESGQKELKGIVLNEMKGAYQDSDRQLILAINSQLFKGTPYAFDTGGNPNQIAELEYSELKNMYQHYYHPSNMAFYYYGKDSFVSHLQYLSEEYLNSYSNQSNKYLKVNLKPFPVEKKYKDIRTYTSECNNISINYLLGQNQSISAIQMSALRIISYILLDKANALLYKQFIQTGVGQTLGFSGLNQGKLTIFAFTIKGIYPNYKSQIFEQTFRKVLTSLIENGIGQQRVKQFVHQFQVKLLTPQQNNGIRILEQSMFLMNHTLDFQAYLNPKNVLNEAVSQLQNKEFLKNLINKFFLQNSQMIVVRQLLAQQEKQQEKINFHVNVPTEQIKQDQDQLKKRQLQPQNAEILPRITLSDLIKPKRLQSNLVYTLDKNKKKYEQFHVKINQSINFYRIVFCFQKLNQLFLQKIMLWTHVLNNSISTSSLNYNQFASKIANITSGFNVSTSLGSQNSFNIIFQFSCLKQNNSQAFSLLKEMIVSPKFEKEHTLNVYKGFSNEWIESLAQSPMQQCINQGGSHLTESGFINNSYQRIKDSLNLIKSNDIQSLYQVSLSLHSCPKVILIQHSNQTAIKTPAFFDQLLEISAAPMFGLLWKPTKMNSLSVIHNYSVNFCTQQYLGPKYLSVQHARMNLILELLQQDYLHPRIRQQGGAYGSGARIRGANTISLFSYLDPNAESTFKVFDCSIEELLSKDRIESLKFQQLKIMQLGEVDRPKVPQSQGVNQILKGYTSQQFDQFREALKSATFLEAIQSSRKYLLNSNKSRVVFGNEIPTQFRVQKLKDFMI